MQRVSLSCLLDLWRQQWPGPLKGCFEEKGENRRCPSEGSVPSGSPVALLVSLSYLSVDGDGVEAPTGEKPVKAEAVPDFDNTACRQSGAWTVMVSTACHTHTRGSHVESLHPYTLHAGAVIFIKPHHLTTNTRRHARSSPSLIPPLCNVRARIQRIS